MPWDYSNIYMLHRECIPVKGSIEIASHCWTETAQDSHRGLSYTGTKFLFSNCLLGRQGHLVVGRHCKLWCSGLLLLFDCLVGLVVRRPPQERHTWVRFLLHCGSFSRSSHTSDWKVGSPVAVLLGTWHCRISPGTGWPRVCILWLGEIESLMCSYISVWQHIQLSEQVHPWDTLACCWDIKQATNNSSLLFELQELSVFCFGLGLLYAIMFILSPYFPVILFFGVQFLFCLSFL